VILSETRLGRYTYAIGGNEETVRLSGVRTNFYKTMVYVFAGVTSAVSAVILTSRLNSAEPVAGMGYELDVIAAVSHRGTSLNGGRGSVWGTLDRALLIAVINNGMVLLGISPYFQQLVKDSSSSAPCCSIACATSLPDARLLRRAAPQRRPAGTVMSTPATRWRSRADAAPSPPGRTLD